MVLVGAEGGEEQRIHQEAQPVICIICSRANFTPSLLHMSYTQATLRPTQPSTLSGTGNEYNPEVR